MTDSTNDNTISADEGVRKFISSTDNVLKVMSTIYGVGMKSNV